jgi:hypothetical protein
MDEWSGAAIDQTRPDRPVATRRRFVTHAPATPGAMDRASNKILRPTAIYVNHTSLLKR